MNKNAELIVRLIPFMEENFITIPKFEEGDYRPYISIFRFINFGDDDEQENFYNSIEEKYQDTPYDVYMDFDDFERTDETKVIFSIGFKGDVMELTDDQLFNIDELLEETVKLNEWLSKHIGKNRKLFL
jgi:hypothetical protein